MTIHQFMMLRRFITKTATIEQALELNQRTFGSLCSHAWLNFNADRRVFQITKEGKNRCMLFIHWDYHRQNNNGLFSSFVELPRNFPVSIQRKRVA